jgi:beta-N-acetylhexosaminidase
MTRHTNLGQLFMVGLQGTTLTKNEQQLLRTMQPAGLTLFSRNLTPDIDQICNLNQSVLDLLEITPIIAIDQEGGAKERLPVPPFTHWAGNPALTKEYLKSGSTQATIDYYRALALELKYLGINTDFAPVVDIITAQKDPRQTTFINDRSFGEDAKIVATLSAAAVKGLMQEGILACAKHFPGHGATTADSHLELPRIDLSADEMNQRDLLPFRAAIEAGCPMIMTAHILYPALDKKFPATLSKPILTDLLKKQLGFKGLIVTDDLNMKAIADRYGDLDAVIMSLKAGSQMMLYCDGVERAFEIYQRLQKALGASDDELQEATVEALHLVDNWKKTYLTRKLVPDKKSLLALLSRQRKTSI